MINVIGKILVSLGVILLSPILTEGIAPLLTGKTPEEIYILADSWVEERLTKLNKHTLPDHMLNIVSSTINYFRSISIGLFILGSILFILSFILGISVRTSYFSILFPNVSLNISLVHNILGLSYSLSFSLAVGIFFAYIFLLSTSFENLRNLIRTRFRLFLISSLAVVGFLFGLASFFLIIEVFNTFISQALLFPSFLLNILRFAILSIIALITTVVIPRGINNLFGLPVGGLTELGIIAYSIGHVVTSVILIMYFIITGGFHFLIVLPVRYFLFVTSKKGTKVVFVIFGGIFEIVGIWLL